MNGSDAIAAQDQFTLGETIFYLSNGAVGSIFNCIVLWIAFVHIDTDDKPRQKPCRATFTLFTFCCVLTKVDLSHPAWKVHVAVSVSTAGIGILDLIDNWHHPKFHGNSNVFRAWLPMWIIVINMTFADLLMCLCYMLTRPYLNFFPKVLCHPYYVTIWTIQLVSCLNLVWLNVDKLIFIQFPLHYYSIINRRKVFIVSVVTWIVLGYIAFAVNAFMTISGGCDRVIINPYIYMPICVLYVVMILTSFIISAIIYFIAHTSTRSETRQRTKLFHRLFFLFSSTLWTFFTCLPYRILYLLNFLCAPCRSEMVHQMTDAFFRILVVGMVINPLITIWTQRIYRMHLLKFFNKWQDTREDTEVSTRRHSTKWNMVESTPLTTAL